MRKGLVLLLGGVLLLAPAVARGQDGTIFTLWPLVDYRRSPGGGSAPLPFPRPPAPSALPALNPIVPNNACPHPGVDCSGALPKSPAGKTYVTWTATDHSGNASQAPQLVNVKAVGSNHVPTALGLSGGTPSAISYEPITLTLTAQDPDQDPLWFKIKRPPANGFFHSPLYPYFIQDYRLANFNNIDFKTYCQDPSHQNHYIPTNWPVNADFMAVADAGTLRPCPHQNTPCTYKET